MVEDTDPQAGASKTAKKSRGGRKGKAVQQVQAIDENETEVIDFIVNEEPDSDSNVDDGVMGPDGCAGRTGII